MKTNQRRNKQISFFEIALSILMCLVSLRVFLPYSSTGILGIIPFVGLLMLTFAVALIVKNTFTLNNIIYYICVLVWIAWFALCLKVADSAAYDINMIICIGIVLMCAASIINNCDEKCIFPVLAVVCVSVFVTFSISMPILNENEMAVREYASGQVNYSASGLGGYEFIYSLVLLCPCLLLLYSVSKGWKKAVVAVVIAASLIYSAYCGLFITFIINISGILLYSISRIKNIKQRNFLIGIIIVVVVLLMLFGTQLLIKLLTVINMNVDNDAINMKLGDLILNLSGEEEEYGTLTSRFDRYLRALTTFAKSPVIGGFLIGETNTSGSHSTIFDYMAITGSFGTLLFLGLIIVLYKSTAAALHNQFSKNTLWIAFGLFFLTSVLKGVSFVSIFWSVTILVPLTVKFCDSIADESVGKK